MKTYSVIIIENNYGFEFESFLFKDSIEAEKKFKNLKKKAIEENGQPDTISDNVDGDASQGTWTKETYLDYDDYGVRILLVENQDI